MVVQGPQVAAFEEEFSARVVGGAHCVAVNSGTSAQHLAALASGASISRALPKHSRAFASSSRPLPSMVRKRPS